MYVVGSCRRSRGAHTLGFRQDEHYRYLDNNVPGSHYERLVTAPPISSLVSCSCDPTEYFLGRRRLMEEAALPQRKQVTLDSRPPQTSYYAMIQTTAFVVPLPVRLMRKFAPPTCPYEEERRPSTKCRPARKELKVRPKLGFFLSYAAVVDEARFSYVFRQNIQFCSTASFPCPAPDKVLLTFFHFSIGLLRQRHVVTTCVVAPSYSFVVGQPQHAGIALFQ